ncbi:MAG: heavy-metal-associated domain-containing protein [candidate division Zixibacteria bacterium]|nr:heavy-metal-associated domain-containing protein [candidate division Zixibacteria bacterium]
MILGGTAFANCAGDAPCGSKAKTTQATKASATVESNQIVLAVSKMTCGGCATHVTKTLTAIDGVKNVDIDLKEGTATVTCDEKKKADPSQLVAAVVKAGYPTKLANATADVKADGKSCSKTKACDPAACGLKGTAAKACGGKK